MRRCVSSTNMFPLIFSRNCVTTKKVSSAKVLNPRNRKRKHEDIAGDDQTAGDTDGFKKAKMNLEENMNRMNVHHDEARVRMEAKPKPKPTPRSRSISKLSKADTSGMKSMMSYFKKSKQ